MQTRINVYNVEQLKTLENERKFPKFVTLDDFISYRIISSGLYEEVESLRFFGKTKKSQTFGTRIFGELLNLKQMKMRHIGFGYSPVFSKCNFRSLIYRSPISHSLVSLELTMMNSPYIRQLAKALNICRLRAFGFESDDDTDSLTASLLLNLDPIEELRFTNLKSAREGFFLKTALKRWRERNQEWKKISLKEEPSYTTGWLGNPLFTEISRSLCERVESVILISNTTTLESGKLLWANNDRRSKVVTPLIPLDAFSSSGNWFKLWYRDITGTPFGKDDCIQERYF